MSCGCLAMKISNISMANLILPIFLISSLSFCSYKAETDQNSTSKALFHVGVILNLDSVSGRVAKSCIEMAVTDFYAIHADYSTRVLLHVRDSKGDVVSAIVEALDLIQNVGVQTIIGPETSEAAEFLAYMGNKTHIPIISFSELSTSLSFTQLPYLVQMADSDSSQVKAVAAIIQAYQWKEVVFIHDDSQSGTAVIPYLTDTLEKIGVVLSSRSVIPHNANDTIMKDALRKLSRTSVRVYIVHLSFSLGSHFFLHVNKLQMMGAGYVWIITCRLTNLLGNMDHHTLRSMEGVIGVRTHVPPSTALRKFKHRWRKQSRKLNHKTKPSEPDVYALWAYDAIFLMAMAANKAISHLERSSPPNSRIAGKKASLMFDVDVSPIGSILQQAVIETHFNGLTGDIQLVNGQLLSSTFKIVNIVKGRGQILGYWTRKAGLSPSLHPQDLKKYYSTNKKDLGLVNWPGGSKDVPSTATLRIAVPIKTGFLEFLNVTHDPTTNTFIVSGFSTEVFDAVMHRLPYHYEYIPFNGSTDSLTQQVASKKFDAAVGDLTIIARRSKYVDYTPPYSTSGVQMIVQVENDDLTQSFWWYVKPLTQELWFTTIAIFFYNGLMVWIFEHQINPEFQGTLSQQIGSALSFSFSILVFAHREKLESNYSRFIVNMWIFAVVILMASYNANLTSMLAVKNLKPSVTDLNYLRVHEKFVGYQKGSFVFELLKDWGFKTKMLKQLSTPEEYADALSRGSEHGGVSAIVDEIPHIKFFLSKYCHGYSVAGPTYQTGGFGFMFPKDSSLLSDVSQAVLEFTEGTNMHDIEKKWFGSQTCSDDTLAANGTTSYKLRLFSFRSIPIFMMVTSAMALFLFFSPFIYKSVTDGTLARKCKAMWRSISSFSQPAGEQEQNNNALSDPLSDVNRDGVEIQQIDELHSNNTTESLEQNHEVTLSKNSETAETEVTATC